MMFTNYILETLFAKKTTLDIPGFPDAVCADENNFPGLYHICLVLVVLPVVPYP
jgi:hypothetical protein